MWPHILKIDLGRALGPLPCGWPPLPLPGLTETRVSMCLYIAFVRVMLGELTRDKAPGPTKALSLDLVRYLVIRKTAHKPR